MRYRDGNKIGYVCDNCDRDCGPDELYIYGSEQLCAECILKRYDTVEEAGEAMRYA